MRTFGKPILITSIAVISIILMFFTILVIRAFKHSSITPDLKIHHDSSLFKESFKYSSYITFKDYLQDEKLFIENIYKKLGKDSSPDPKYRPGNISNPQVDSTNLNRSSIYHPPKKVSKGVALVVHGLSDSPYHMLHIIETLVDKNYTVINLRLPGHGTAPGGLLSVKWQNWAEAVDFGVNMSVKELENTTDKKFITIGFSTGGALLIRHLLKEIKSSGNRVPDKLILYSPAASITKQAFFADFHEYISWFPGLEKFKWMDVLEEMDPYKYQSFPKNAAYQIYKLTESNKRIIEKIAKNKELLDKIPPIITFQSPFDATVEYKGIVSLYQKIGNKKSQLILFAQNSVYQGLYYDSVKQVISSENFKTNIFDSELYIIKNIKSDNHLAALYKAYVNKENSFEYILEDGFPQIPWPEKVFAQSHISPHIKDNDAFYGKESVIFTDENNKLKGERGLLKDETSFVRLKYNPFYSITNQIIRDSI